MTRLETTLAALTEKFGAALSVSEFRGETTVTVRPAALLDLLRFLHEAPELKYLLADLTAYDEYPTEPRFIVVYQLREMKTFCQLRVKCAVPGSAPSLPTAALLFPNANWYERELFDLFGLTFTGHPDLRRILTAEGTEGHPLRKDHPLGYEEVEFTFNFDELEQRKLYAKK